MISRHFDASVNVVPVTFSASPSAMPSPPSMPSTLPLPSPPSDPSLSTCLSITPTPSVPWK
ncbi:hypothetical protein E2C01_028516 [Portunus trituberculatus]|uniref:Uncharacterized protein n=1 Tax=Portunus trituberculatus TaxID=210409 RepID=A0A5B7ELR3_PORTR|nr:hypothetical protein [Portunus trituberculatus]